MSSFNKVILMGRLTRDPEVRYAPSGSAICNLSLALNRTWTQDGQKKEEVTFCDVVFYSKAAETISQYLKKGSSLLLEGRLRVEQWEDKQTQQKRSKMVVVGESFQFFGGKSESSKKERRLPDSQTTGEVPVVEYDVPF